MTTHTPSSATTGFFQTLPDILQSYSSNDQHSDDRILQRILNLYLPSPIPTQVSTSLHKLSRRALSPSTLALTVDAETNHPTLNPLTTFGEENTINPLRTSHGWRALKDIGIEEGTVGYGYHQPKIENQSTWNRRIHQFTSLHLWQATAALTTCPMAMTDGAAVLLSRHLSDPDDSVQPGRSKVFKEAYRRLITLDSSEAWTSGQWMTERSGGSNVSGTETVARLMTKQELQRDIESGRHEDGIGMPLGPWQIDGFKWFSSATDADMVVLLAQTPKGLSAFYAPMRRKLVKTNQTPRLSSASTSTSIFNTEMNGVRIIRLKDKLGTKALPTAELEIRGMRAYLIGIEGQGIKEISSILNITRLWTASGIAVLGRGLAVSRAFSKTRRLGTGTKSHLLSQNIQHVKWMADETIKYWAATHLSFFGIALLGVSEQGYKSVNQQTKSSKALISDDMKSIGILLRIITPTAKSQCSLVTVSGLRNCMESLGGVGYCENEFDYGILNIARLYRNANVSCIWEGTTSVMADDVIRVFKSSSSSSTNSEKNNNVSLKIFENWVEKLLNYCQKSNKEIFKDEISKVKTSLEEFIPIIRDAKSIQELQYIGRDILETLEFIICSCLLMYDALTDMDDIAIATAKRWVDMRSNGEKKRINWKDEIEMDKRIFLGDVQKSDMMAKL